MDTGQNFRRWLCRLLLVFCLAAGVLLFGCTSKTLAQDSWAVYIYMCGSDLESEQGMASKNLASLQSVPLPDNVRFFIQTGGAHAWHTEGIPSEALGRFVYDSKGFHKLAELEQASMAEEKTFEDFLRYAKDNYPADHRMLIFWDHGGGSLNGLCYDEKYEESLSLNDVQQAMAAVAKADKDAPFFDLVLFDMCLMANIETANTLYGYTRYITASEEVMPGTGSDYAGWVGALTKKPSMDGRALGKIICETYLPYCAKYQSEDSATLSLLDMQKLPALNDAYEAMGQEIQEAANANPREVYTAYDRVAHGGERYGINVEDNWTNMIDLGNLAEHLQGIESAEALQQAIKDVVVYRVAGPYRQHGWGLAGYYCLDGSVLSLAKYTPQPGASPVFIDFYRNMLSGSGGGEPWYHFDTEKIAQSPLVIGPDNTAVVTLPPEDVHAISDAAFWLGYNDKNGQFVFLGSSDSLTVDWENGVFQDDFDCTWPALNGHTILLDLDEHQPDYNMFHSYILLNDKKCYLRAAYNKEKAAWKILSVQRLIEDEQLDREVLQLHAGDKITPLFLLENGKMINGESFVLDKEPALQNEPLADGKYTFAFNFRMPRNDAVDSACGYFVLEGGKLIEVGNL